jgi:ribosomal protein L31E
MCFTFFSYAQDVDGYILFPKCKELEDNKLRECNIYELRKFISHHLEYPQIVIDDEYEGKVSVRYALTPEGELEISNEKNLEHSSLNEAAIRVMQELNDSIRSGKFKVIPAKINGVAVRSSYRIPIRFTLPKKETEVGDKKKMVIATYRTSEKTVQFRRDLEGNIYAYSLFPQEEKFLAKMDGNKDPTTLTEEERSYFFLYNLTFLKPEILLTLGNIEGKEYELFIDKSKGEEDDDPDSESPDIYIKVYSLDHPKKLIEVFTNVDQLFESKYAVLLFK